MKGGDITEKRPCPAARCLCVGDITSESNGDFGRLFFHGAPGVEVVSFRRGDARDMWDRLQAALNGGRDDRGGAVILARGTGCAAALALAEQLPAERVALIEPFLAPPRGGTGAFDRLVGRMGRFAYRNLPLCAADVLVAARAGNPAWRRLRPGALWPHGRLIRLEIPAGYADNMLNNRENMVNRAISCFLQTGELPKPLAKNAEMCIIDG